MCGIAGAIVPGFDKIATRQLIERMTDPIIHRGPDDSGSIGGDGVVIGMRRLSIIDLSGGHQPIANERGDVHVVCNGEIYNFQALRAELIARGHRFSTKSDSEVAVHLYEEYGDRFLEHMRGMFGLALWDQRQQRLLLARDRLGKKPLFHASQGDRFYFGSEMKSILAAEPSLATPDYRRLGQFFQFGYILQPDTIYRDIHRLPAGHYGIHQQGKFTIHPYWELQFEPDEKPTEAQWMEELEATLLEAVRIRLESDVPLGVFLSGGLDSSAVVALAHQAGLKPIKTFTIGFDREEWDESEDARRVADQFGTDHHVLTIRESDLCDRFEETLQQAVHYFDEPFGDASSIPTFHVSRLARQHVKVILSGDGGDELFAGYSSYLGALFGQRYRQWVPFGLGRYVFPSLFQGAASILPGRLHYQALRAAKVLRDSALPMAQGYRDKSSIWTLVELDQLLTGDARKNMDFAGERYLPDRWWKRLQTPGDLVGRLSEIDIHTYMLDDILVKVDRMSMANSLEVRSPLLDYKVVELAARIPTRFKVRNGRGKHLLRRVLESKLPAPTMKKKKQGFSVPLRDWFRGTLRGLVHDCLGAGSQLPGEIFEAKHVRRILSEHDRGSADHARKIWLLLVFATWHRQQARYASHGPFQPDPLASPTGAVA
jgi:asparagine synthase (glutamine-hydrolysing)